MLLAIDPGTNSFGLALFDIPSGKLAHATTLVTDPKGCTVQRLVNVHSLVYNAMGTTKITDIAVEFYPKSQIPFIAIGAILAGLTNCTAQISKTCLVTPTSWKAYVKRCKDLTKPLPEVIKGIAALECMGLDIAVDSDDAADAVLIGLCWLDKKRTSQKKPRK